MYVYCVYPAISKSQKQLPNCLQLTETSVFLIVSVESYVTLEPIPLPFYFPVALHESDTRNALLGP